MKKISTTLFSLLLAGSTFISCSDSYMEDMNTDPSKASKVSPSSQLTLAQLQTYGDFDANQVNRSYICTFTQMFTGTWNAANYGGATNPDDQETSRLWNDFYTVSVKNIVDAINRTEDGTAMNSALRIYRVYLMSIITDIYGDIPCKEAGLGFISNNNTPKYDTQEEIYNFFFDELKACEANLSVASDRISGDLIYGGDVAKWRKLANSLRMRFAMRVSDVAPEKAKSEFETAAALDYIKTADDDAMIAYMDAPFNTGEAGTGDYRGNAFANILLGQDITGPTYVSSTLYNNLKNNNDPRHLAICRFYYEELRTNLTNDNRPDITTEVLTMEGKGAFTVKPCNPGQPWWKEWPTEYDSETAAALAVKYGRSDLKTKLAQETRPKLNMNFENSENPGVVFTAAEANLLLAEAKIKGWSVGNKSVKEYFEEGVRLAMEQLKVFGVKKLDTATDKEAYITTDEINAYLASINFDGLQAEQQRARINYEAWLLHLTNPYEQWANLRRSDYPVLYNLRHYTATQEYAPVDGYSTPLRLKYPRLESTYNKANYEEAKNRMGGNDDWHHACWWDKDNKELDVE